MLFTRSNLNTQNICMRYENYYDNNDNDDDNSLLRTELHEEKQNN